MKHGHGKFVCQYGTVHGRCRCVFWDERTHRIFDIDCSTPEYCRPPRPFYQYLGPSVSKDGKKTLMWMCTTPLPGDSRHERVTCSAEWFYTQMTGSEWQKT